jgi:hypothetical protein
MDEPRLTRIVLQESVMEELENNAVPLSHAMIRHDLADLVGGEEVGNLADFAVGAVWRAQNDQAPEFVFGGVGQVELSGFDLF